MGYHRQIRKPRQKINYDGHGHVQVVQDGKIVTDFQVNKEGNLDGIYLDYASTEVKETATYVDGEKVTEETPHNGISGRLQVSSADSGAKETAVYVDGEKVPKEKPPRGISGRLRVFSVDSEVKETAVYVNGEKVIKEENGQVPSLAQDRGSSVSHNFSKNGGR